MPRKATEDKGEGKIIPISNGFDPDITKSFVERVENLQGEIDAIMEKAREACQPMRDDIKEVIKEAAAAGYAKKPFRALISKRRKLSQAEAIGSELNDDQKETLEQMQHALGMLSDLPLGEAATRSAGH